jgi:hypothetical protein
VILHPSVRTSFLELVAEIPENLVVMRGTLQRDRLYHVNDDSTEVCAAGAPESAPTSIDNITQVVPFTFAANRTEILGSKGCVRKGSQAGLTQLQVLHLRTGHASKVTLLTALKANALHGAQTTYATCLPLEIGFCEACTIGNMRTEAVPRSHREYSKLKPFEEIGIDPVPLSTKTVDGNTVITMGVDYGTKTMFAYESKTDGQQTVTMAKIKRDWCEPYGHTIKVAHTDFASYFIGAEFQEYCLQERITHDASAPYAHQHNLVEGSCVRIVMNRARVLLADSGLPASFAGHAIRAAIQSWNSMLHPIDALQTPIE